MAVYPPDIACHYRKPHSGSVYVAVLGVAIIVAVIGISSLHIARLETREAVVLDEMARARVAARSGIECVAAVLKTSPLWRSTYVSGVTNQLALLATPLDGDDSFEFVLIDTDGNLNDDKQDTATLHVVGTSGKARHVLEVMLAPSGIGVNSLSASLHSDNDMDVKEPVVTNQTISSNEDIRILSNGSVSGNAQAVGTITGTPTGTKTQGMNPALEMPDPNDVFDYYVANGTPIGYSQLPSGKIEKVVLSPNNNPFGSQVTNSQGIYVINCQGNKVAVMDSRIVGTLVFINASSNIEIEKSIAWDTFVPNFPAVMVQGKLHLKWAAQTNLSEASTGVNFNPSHTPYQSTADSDKSDSYTGLISGLIYSTGDLEVTGPTSHKGVVLIGGDAKIDKTFNVIYSSKFYNSAPPGFGAGAEVKLVPGTWKQVSY